MSRDCLLVTVSGTDHPGITSELMKILVKHDTKLLDLGQSVTHGLLSLSLMLDIDDAHPVVDDLLAAVNKMGLTFGMQSIKADKKLPEWKEKYVLSCAGPAGITSAFLGDVASLFYKYGVNIQRVENMSGEGFKALDISARSNTTLDRQKIKFELMNLCNLHKIDAAFMQDNAFRYNKRLIVFDMDSTLIQAEVIDEMAAVHGIGEKVKKITERAMNGEINFDDALRERVALLKGLKREKMEEIFGRLPLTNGAEKFIQTVQQLGYKTAIVSGGIRYFTESLQKKLKMDYAFSNDLEFDGDTLNGKIKGEIVNAQKKAQLLEQLAKQEGINLEQVVAIGDGANDLPMLAKAGLGIAFHAKEKVRMEAGHLISHGPMTSILYFLGIPGNHLE